MEQTKEHPVVDDYQIDIVARALTVLGLFDYRHRQLDLQEVAARAQVSRSRAYRILRTLAACDFVTITSHGQQYRLGPAAARLGFIARVQDRIGRALSVIMHRLLEEFEETVNLAFLDGNSVVYGEVLESPHPFRISEKVGQVVPLTSTAIGRSILAALDDPLALLPEEEFQQIADTVSMARARGYAIDDEETIPGARCVGVALRDPRGEIFGALSISGPTTRMDDAAIPIVAARLILAAQEIATLTGIGEGA